MNSVSRVVQGLLKGFWECSDESDVRVEKTRNFGLQEGITGIGMGSVVIVIDRTNFSDAS